MPQKKAIEQNWPRARREEDFKSDDSRPELPTDRLSDTSVPEGGLLRIGRKKIKQFKKRGVYH